MAKVQVVNQEDSSNVHGQGRALPAYDPLNIKSEVHNIPITDDVLFAFQA